MIKGIWQIGKWLLQDTGGSEVSFVENLVEEVQERGEKLHVVSLKLQTEPPSLDLDQAELNEERMVNYLWIGNAGSNDDQDRVTTNRKGSSQDHLEYLISQTIPNLLKPGRLPEGELRSLIQKAFDNLYMDLGEKDEVFQGSGGDQQYERYRSLWDLRKMGIQNAPTKDELIAVTREQGTAKAAVGKMQKFLMSWICEKLNLRPRDIALYTLEIDGTLLAQHEEYRRYIFKRVVSDIFKGTSSGICHICGEEKQVTDNMKFFKFLKFYNTDKIGFASELDERSGFYRTYALCQDCYMVLLTGETFVRKSLRSNLACNDVYIIPSFLFPINLSPRYIKRWAEYLQGYIGKLTSLKGWQEFQNKLEEFREIEESKPSFLLNFLFARRMQAEMRIQKLVQEIPPSRLDFLIERRNEIKRLGDDLFGEFQSWDLNLGTIFYLFPVRKRQREVLNAEVLGFYEALFTGKPVRYSFLIGNFLEVARMYRYENFGAYMHNPPQGSPESTLVRFLLQSALLIRYLKELCMLGDHQGGVDMKEVGDRLPVKLSTYIGEMGYTEPQASLFLLGYLIGQVGIAQYTPGSEKKPILNKLNFLGMSFPKVQRLSNEIFEKLEQYRVLPYNEGIFSAMKLLLDKNRGQWSLTPQENVYYILSGYAYATWGAMHGKHEQETEGKEDRDGSHNP